MRPGRHRHKKQHRPRRPPQAVDESSHASGLRAVAVFEALKGALVLLLGLGLLSLIHKDVEEFAENLVFHLRINPDHRFGNAILNAASKVTDGRLWGYAAAAFAYAGVKSVESWGLWNRRVWAEWFALLSGALYLPLEIIKLAEKANWIHIAVFVINVAIVLYMLSIRVKAYRAA